jgi:hypothetical protein
VFILHAQESIKAIILNVETELPIRNVNIYIKNTSIGVISNEEGLFQISISSKYNKGILVFSAIGFQTLEVGITNFKSTTHKTIALKPSTTILDEVVLSTNKLTANEIVQKAFDNYYKIFPNKPFVSNGFIRHTEETNGKYKWLIEAAINVYDTGYNKKDKGVSVNVVEMRKSLDNREIDTAQFYRSYLHDNTNYGFKKRQRIADNFKELNPAEIKKAITYRDNHYTLGYNNKIGFLEKFFTTNYNKIRYYDKKNASFSKKNLNFYKFKIDTIINYQDQYLYKIKFSASTNKKSASTLLLGWLFVRSNDFAIVEMQYSVLLSKNHHYRKVTGVKTAFNTILKFRLYNGKMYPYYISHKDTKINNLTALFHTSKLQKEEDKQKKITYTYDEFIFTEIITDKEEIQLLLQKPWNDDLFSPLPYHKQFWKNYNVLLESNEQQKMIQDLEKKVKLKEQFKESN